MSAELRNVTDRSRIGRQFHNTPHADRIRQVYGDSARLDWDRFGSELDLVFIDGCHAFDYVKSDSDNATRRLRPGGVVVWHDYGMMEDVSRAVDEVAGVRPPQVIRGTRLAVAVK